MWIQSIDISGLYDLPQCTLDNIPAEGMTFRETTAETTALADAIGLWFAAFDDDAMVDWVINMGWAYEEEIEVFGEQHIEEILWVDGSLPRLWVDERDVSVHLKIGLESSMIQEMRGFILEPDVLVSLLEERTLSATVTVRFTNDYRVMAIGIHGLQLGSVRLPVEKPVWVPKLYELMTGRFYRDNIRQSIPEMALQALLSIEGFDRYQSFQDACAMIGSVRVVGGRDRTPILLVDNLPLRRLGLSTLEQVRVLASWYLTPSDIVWNDVIVMNRPSLKQIWGIDATSSNDGHHLNALSGSTPIQFRP